MLIFKEAEEVEVEVEEVEFEVEFDVITTEEIGDDGIVVDELVDDDVEAVVKEVEKEEEDEEEEGGDLETFDSSSLDIDENLVFLGGLVEILVS